VIQTVRYALGSVLIGIIVLALKFLAYAITGSSAFYSDAIESIVNIVAACAAVIALQVSAIPADEKHQYGHGKAEYFSAVLEGVMIVIAALAIFREAWHTLFHLHVLHEAMRGLIFNGVATLINAAWATALIRKGRNFRSPALTADGRHLFADVATSSSIFAGVILVELTGWLWLDPTLAMLVALHILWSGWRVIRESISGLMDEAVPEAELERIRTVIFDHAQGAYQAHDLRTRRAGHRIFIDFHLVVPGDMSVGAAHNICDRLEKAIEEEITDSTVTIHVEPEYKAKVSNVYISR
jgi:cation diffusion facilitator family transporter